MFERSRGWLSALVLAWCAQQGLDNDHCYAKRLSATTAYEPNSKHP